MNQIKNRIYKFNELPKGAIIWYKTSIIGVVGVDSLELYVNSSFTKVKGNCFDYELING